MSKRVKVQLYDVMLIVSQLHATHAHIVREAAVYTMTKKRREKRQKSENAQLEIQQKSSMLTSPICEE